MASSWMQITANASGFSVKLKIKIVWLNKNYNTSMLIFVFFSPYIISKKYSENIQTASLSCYMNWSFSTFFMNIFFFSAPFST